MHGKAGKFNQHREINYKPAIHISTNFNDLDGYYLAQVQILKDKKDIKKKLDIQETGET